MHSLIQSIRRVWLASGGGARWALLLGLLSLCLLIPAIFMPAMLVANAVDGASYYSIWTSIQMLRDRGATFLAGVIFVFSIIFPVAKLGLLLLAAGCGRWLSETARRRIVFLTEWTSKYSMLDVYVMAMLVLLIKVDQFVKMLPAVGLYMFCASVFSGALASGALKLAHKEHDLPPPAKGKPWIVLTSCLLGALLLSLGLSGIRKHWQGQVSDIQLVSLTNRPLPRSFERMIGLKELMKPEHDFFSRDTVRLLVDALQAATTDAGLQKQQGYLIVGLADGQQLRTPAIPIVLGEGPSNFSFSLPQEVGLRDIQSIELKTHVEFTKLLPAELSEERIEAGNDWSRAWHRAWYGRIFEYHLNGRENSGKQVAIVLAAAGLLLMLWGISGAVIRLVRRQS